MSVELPELVVGDTLEFLTTVEDYPPADGWTFKIKLRPLSGANDDITLTATTSGTDYLIQEAPATTSGWDAGDYSWSSWVEKSGARHVIESGLTTILADPTGTGANDTRSTARKILDGLLEERAAAAEAARADVSEYTIGNRTMKYRGEGAIDADIRYWTRVVEKEENEKRLDAGLGASGRLQARL